ncbi:unnamed protein product [marine sediment metagenome]|uniref:ATP synthase subunit a n=1 Tax=marine sediment metagenome TaxID=412755 RepID=X0SK08_9ZZZZ
MIALAFSPDEIVFYEWGFFKLNATIVYTWVVMAVLVVGSWLVTRRLSSGPKVSRWQNLLEVVVNFLRNEIRGLSQQNPDLYLPFIGTLFLFIAVSNILDVVPGFTAPTGSLSTTVALAICVFVAVPIYGVANQGVGSYLKNYIKPSPFMLPFNIIGELSRTLALAVRLFGNVMSGTKVATIMVSLVPLVVPTVMQALGLLIGLIQAYIFAVLAMVYIAAGMRRREAPPQGSPDVPSETATEKGSI